MPHPRTLKLILFTIAVLICFQESLCKLAIFAYSSDFYFYILLVPLVSGYFIYRRAAETFSKVDSSHAVGAAIFGIGCAIQLASKLWKSWPDQDDYLCVSTASILLIWVGGFIFLYGVRTFRSLAFPLCFLLLMVPLPSRLLSNLVQILQSGSAEAAYWMMKVTGFPVTRANCKTSRNLKSPPVVLLNGVTKHGYPIKPS
jgi:exosortase